MMPKCNGRSTRGVSSQPLVQIVEKWFRHTDTTYVLKVLNQFETTASHFQTNRVSQ